MAFQFINHILNKKLKTFLNVFIKSLLTIVALFFVFKKIDLNEFKNTLVHANIYYFLLAFLTFNISKIISAYRLKGFYKAVGLSLNKIYNLRLYYVGMFYNLFLPGSIGGDGYKVYLLKQNSAIKLKELVGATLLDRFSGLVLLVFFGLFLACFSTFTFPNDFYLYILISLIALIIPAYYFIIKIAFPKYLLVFFSTTHQSFWVQGGQVICALFLLISLGVEEYYIDYLVLFMFSSIIAVLPISIGGAGAREVFFLSAAKYFNIVNIKGSAAVAFTFSFFIVTAITSLVGFFFSFNIDKSKNKNLIS